MDAGIMKPGRTVRKSASSRFTKSGAASGRGTAKATNLVVPAHAEVPVHLRIPWALRRVSGSASTEESVEIEIRGELELRRGPTTEHLPFSRRERDPAHMDHGTQPSEPHGRR